MPDKHAGRGKGAAVKTALSYIRNEMWNDDLIGIMDCDGQHLPEDMRKVLAFAEQHRDSLVLGVRTVGKEMPLRSRLGNRYPDGTAGVQYQTGGQAAFGGGRTV